MQKDMQKKKKKPSPKLMTVIATTQVTPNMQRITLQGEALAKFPQDCEGSYIKLIFNAEGSTDIDLATMGEGQRPSMRTYTIRSISHEKQTIDVDFVRHITHDLQCGFAGRWAANAQVGDKIYIAGPGAIQDINTDVDWFFMAADMTALPALSAKARLLPDNAKGYAVIKVLEQVDVQELNVPDNLEIIWITDQSLEEKVRELAWLQGEVFVWVACEFDSMRALRTYFRNEKDVDRENIYISSYWKNGVTEDGHKAVKQQDAQDYQQ